MNKKTLYAAVATVAAYLLAYKIARPETVLAGAVGHVALGAVVALPIVAIAFSVLGMREARASRTQRMWPAIVTLVLATMFIVPMGFYGVRRVLPTSRTQALPTTDAQPWTRFTSPAGDYSVLLPGPATETTENVPRWNGPGQVRSLVVEGRSGAYSVTVGSVPDEDVSTSTRLDRLLGELETRAGGKVVARSEVTSGTTSGREVRIESSKLWLRARIFVMNGNVYQLLVLHRSGEDDRELDDRFLDSLVLLPK